MKVKKSLVGIILGISLALSLLGLLSGGAPSQAAPANAPAAELHVCPSGCPYSSIQAAVNAANPGDVIKVAQGTYDDVHTIPSLNTGSFTATQIVAITQSLTLRGGYTTSDWNTPDPAANPAILDAQGQGRGIIVVGAGISPTIEGFHVTGGDATGLGGTPWYGIGGGFYIQAASPTISNNLIYSNTSPFLGGGLYTDDSSAVLNGNAIHHNSATTRGGGVYANSSPLYLYNNTLYSNTTGTEGGGVCAYQSDVTLEDNRIYSNAAQKGGGCYLQRGSPTLRGNVITGNTANDGGGLYLWDGTTPTLINTVIAGNQANAQGDGLFAGGGDYFSNQYRLIHSTIAGNGEQGLFAGNHATLILTNTVVASHTVGISVTAGGTASLNTTLWHANDTDWSGNVLRTNDYSGDPAFALDGYHLTTDSLAIDRGIDAGVTVDVDGDSRPQGAGYDIGADEFPLSPPEMTWGKQVAINAGPFQDWQDGPFTVAPGDLVTVVERVWITSTIDVSFTLGEAWTPSLEWVGYQASTGSLSQSGQGGTWSVSGAPANAWHALTQTLRVVASPDYADSLTESLTVQGAPYQLPERVVVFQHSQPQPVWLKTVQVNDDAPLAWDAGPFPVRPGDALTIVDRLWVTHTQNVSFHLTQTWSAELHLLGWARDAGAVTTGTGQLAWHGAEQPPNQWQGLTSTWQISGSGWLYQSLTETLSVPGAESQPAPRVIDLLNLDASSGCYARINDGTTTYPTLQAAVDVAQAGDLVKVAGYCSDVNHYHDLAQVLYLDKSLTIQGGYTTTNWSAPDPSANPTTLDAQGQGRVVYIKGNISPTLDGLRLTGGDAAGLGGAVPPAEGDVGGGLYVDQAAAHIQNSQIASNTAQYGGGLFLSADNVHLAKNDISHNKANYGGGGLSSIRSQAITLSQNTISSNEAEYGGGLFFRSSDATLSQNTIHHNVALKDAGGLDLGASSGSLVGNTIQANQAQQSAGGLRLTSSQTQLNGNLILSNTARYNGGGLYIESGDTWLVNDVLVDNQVGASGGGLYVQAASPRLLHITLAHNTGGDGSGAHVTDSVVATSSLRMTNSLVAEHTVGITLTANNQAILNTTLWHANGTNWSGEGSVEHLNDRSGDPVLAADGYHLGSTSAAIDQGLDAGVTTDVDGQTRPQASGYDIGADEFTCVALTEASVAGPSAGIVQTSYIFRANLSPSSASPPITYTWSPAPASGQGTDSARYTWSTTGTHIISLTAQNCGGSQIDAHTITISQTEPGCPIPLSDVTIDGPTTGYVDAAYTLNASLTPTDATPPISYTWSPEPASGQGTGSARYTWSATGTYTISLTAQNCGGSRTDSHQISITAAGYHVYLPIIVRNP